MRNRIPISLRIDREVLQWFRNKQPKGYQTMIHSVLEEYVKQRTYDRVRAVGRAQEIFRQYYAQCFWHYDKDLQIDLNNIELVVDGLRKYGGRAGLLLAEELCQ